MLYWVYKLWVGVVFGEKIDFEWIYIYWFGISDSFFSWIALLFYAEKELWVNLKEEFSNRLDFKLSNLES